MSKDQIDEYHRKVEAYNKKQSETEKWLIDYTKWIIGISGGALSFTLGAVLNHSGQSLLAHSWMLKFAWASLAISISASCILVGVVIASTYVQLERLRRYNDNETQEPPDYPRWNEPARNWSAFIAILTFVIGFALIGAVLVTAT